MISNTGSGELRAFAQRIERLEEAKAEIAQDIKEVYAEVKSAGFTPAILRKLVAERKKDPQKLAEEKELLDLYRDAVNGELFPEAVTVTVTPAPVAAVKPKTNKAKADAVRLKPGPEFAEDNDPLVVGGIKYLTQEGADEAREKIAALREANMGGPTEEEVAF